MQVFYLSPASGSQFKAVIKLKYPYVLINYMTKLSKHFAKIVRQFCRILLIDSGGFPSSFIYNGYKDSDERYLAFVKSVKADYFVLRDYPCEPQILKKFNTSVRDQIHKTLEHHIKLLDLFERSNLNAQPIPVIQGWKIEDYLYCLDLFDEYGLLGKFDYIAIGSTCRRHQVKYTQRIILTIRKELPKRKRLHAFGVKLSVLRNKAVWDSLYSVDSSAWDYPSRFKQIDHYDYCLNYVNKLKELEIEFAKQGVLNGV